MSWNFLVAHAFFKIFDFLCKFSKFSHLNALKNFLTQTVISFRDEPPKLKRDTFKGKKPISFLKIVLT